MKLRDILSVYEYRIFSDDSCELVCMSLISKLDANLHIYGCPTDGTHGDYGLAFSIGVHVCSRMRHQGSDISFLTYIMMMVVHETLTQTVVGPMRRPDLVSRQAQHSRAGNLSIVQVNADSNQGTL